MGRSPRLQIPGGFHHVTTRGNRKQRIYVDARDALEFERLLARVVRSLTWRVHSYCWMPTHYHLLVETPEPNLSAGMQRLNGVYAKSFNYAHGFAGHLFERRFRCVVVDNEPQLHETARYVALNPVRAGLCREPVDWPWSSYAAMIGRAAAPDFLTCNWLLSQFGPDRERARARFAEFVEVALDAERAA
ncbi:MAG: transposase [Actinomycetota bacterium]|nr:transposase [Actinomycetota bacterium]